MPNVGIDAKNVEENIVKNMFMDDKNLGNKSIS